MFIPLLVTLLIPAARALHQHHDHISHRGQLPRKTNILIFLVDDLGIGDIGCYGNDTIKTPNIDSIARHGVKFEHNLSPETVCTPSRAALLTGRYAIRSGMASDAESPRVVISTAASGGLPENETTYGRIFQQNGYKTAYFGKWHLGVHKNGRDFLHHPINHGFDYYYGMPLSNSMILGEEGTFAPGVNTAKLNCFILLHKVSSSTLRLIFYTTLFNAILIICSSLSKRWKLVFIFISLFIIIWTGGNLLFLKFLRHTNGIVMRNKKVIEQPVHLPDLTTRLTAEVVDFIDRSDHTPFLSVVSYHKVHTALAVDENFLGRSDHGLYGDSVEEMDWSVGKIMSALKEHGLLNDTFVYFTSDHGPATFIHVNGEMHGGWPGVFKGGKGNNWEGGIRVPTLAMWPNHFTAGSIYSRPTSGLDLYPTLMKIIGVSLPSDRIIDGVDFSNKLSSNYGKDEEDRFFFHYCGTAITAVTYEHGSKYVWKLHYQIPQWPSGMQHFNKNCLRCFGDGIVNLEKPLLFDIVTDKSEREPLSDKGEIYQQVMSKIGEAIVRHKKTIKYVENQLAREKQAFSSVRMTCCNYPWCSCREKKTVS